MQWSWSAKKFKGSFPEMVAFSRLDIMIMIDRSEYKTSNDPKKAPAPRHDSDKHQLLVEPQAYMPTVP